jgi:hypothetical protein
LRIADFGLMKGMEHSVCGETDETGGRARRDLRSEIRCLRSGVKLISILRLLTSMMDDFNDFNDQ